MIILRLLLLLTNLHLKLLSTLELALINYLALKELKVNFPSNFQVEREPVYTFCSIY